MGKVLIGFGVVLVAIGLILNYAPGLLSWFGRLPGDIRIQNEKSAFYMPFMSMLVISIVLSILANLLFRR